MCSVTQLYPNLWDTVDYSPSGSSVLEILQARILEQVAISFSRRSSWPRDQAHFSWVSCISGCALYHCTTLEALIFCRAGPKVGTSCLSSSLSRLHWRQPWDPMRVLCLCPAGPRTFVQCGCAVSRLIRSQAVQGRTGKEDILGFSFNLRVLPAGLRLHSLERKPPFALIM